MNPRHLTTLVWLRWRLTLAELRRMGVASRVVIGLLLTLVAVTSLVGFVLTLVLGILFLPKAQPDQLLILCDVLAVSFLFFWLIGFLSELQRSEPFSLEKLLHLPISLRGAFLLNYLSSFASLTMVVFLPAMLALCIALPLTLGWRMILVLPLLTGFLLLTTAVTFQIRGWLATLMSTPRRRRRVLVVLTTLMVLVFQIPGLVSMWINRSGRVDEGLVQQQEELSNLDQQIVAENITSEERRELIQRKQQARYKVDAAEDEQSARTTARALRWLKRGHMAIPFGWFPYGVYRLAERAVWPAVVAICGLVGLAAISLRFSYRSTLRFYRQAGPVTCPHPSSRAATEASRTATLPQRKNGLRRPFPLLPPQPGMIARANFCSLLRAPEVKMQLLGPVLVMVLMAFPLFTNKEELPAAASPLVALGFLVFANLASVNLVFNQFGYDRDGFRSYMLWPVSGRDLMFGKNASLVPISLTVSLLAVAVASIILPAPILDGLACLPAACSILLIWLMLGNFASIRFPLPVSASAMRKSQPNWKSALAQFFTVMLMPIFLTPVAIPMAIQSACRHFGWLRSIPIALILELVVLAVATWIYWQLLPVSGRFLKSREQQILNEVTRRDE